MRMYYPLDSSCEPTGILILPKRVHMASNRLLLIASPSLRGGEKGFLVLDYGLSEMGYLSA
jgi:hypothetical protein